MTSEEVTVARLTRAELQAQLDEANALIAGLQDESSQLREAREVLEGPADKEPMTEVGYLRQELAYAQGQLHQSHLTVKQLCARINFQERIAPPVPATLGDGDLNAIQELSEQVRELMAHLINRRDTAQLRSSIGECQHAPVQPI